MVLCGIMAASSMTYVRGSAENILELNSCSSEYQAVSAANNLSTKKLADYSIWKQSTDVSCWAVAISSMDAYVNKRETPLTEEQMNKKMTDAGGDGSNGATINEALAVMKEIFPSENYTVSKAPSMTDANILSNIKKGSPIYLHTTRVNDKNKTVAHAVVIIGYTYNNDTKKVTDIYYANPANGEISSTAYNGTKTKITSGNYTYTWSSAITVKPKK